jgi:hypothetical protein
MYRTLLRLWLLMDIPTSGQRQALLRNAEIWTDTDIYNAQLFFMKLLLAFNDPVHGPGGFELLHLFLGQKGLFPLWQLLMRKKFTTLPELIDLQVRYEFDIPPELDADPADEQTTIHGVPHYQVGIKHYEGWGMGDTHLLRPDELVPIEATARTLDLERHLMYMMMWGYFDTRTGENIVPTEEDMYMSDEENVLRHMDTSHHWKKKHAMKKKFFHLSAQEKKEILDQDEDDRLRALAWAGDASEYDDEGAEQDRIYTLEEEIERGFIVRPPRTGDDKVEVPDKNDEQGWVEFVNSALRTVVPEITQDQKLRVEALYPYPQEQTDEAVDWGALLAQEEAERSASLGDSEQETVILEEGEMSDDEEASGGDVESDEEMGDPLLAELSEYLSGEGVEPSPALGELLGRNA